MLEDVHINVISILITIISYTRNARELGARGEGPQEPAQNVENVLNISASEVKLHNELFDHFSHFKKGNTGIGS